MQLNPYLFFNRECEAAFQLYAQAPRGYSGRGAVPAEWLKKILHARLIVNGQGLMASDAPPPRYERPKGYSVSLQVNTPAEAERIFHSLTENGQVQMPIQQTFWTARFGMLVDRFGIPWMINCEKAA